MRHFYVLYILLLFSTFAYSQTAGFTYKKTPVVRAAGDYFGNSVAISDNYLIAGSYQNSTDSNNINYIGTAGAAYIYELSNNKKWIQKKKLIASDRMPGDQYGYSVSISGNYAVVGAPYWDINNAMTNTNDGAAYVYNRNANGTWVQKQRLLAADQDTSDNFGISVTISGNFIVIGAFKDEQDSIGLNRMNNSGSAYFFERDTINDVWIQTQKVVGTHRAVGDNFGNSVAIFNNTAVIGAMYHTKDSVGGNTISNAGAAYVFERNIAGKWNQIKKITAADRSFQAYFGSSVSVNSNNIAIGAYFEGPNSTGAVYTFKKFSSTWNYLNKLTASDKQMFDSFGRSVSLSNNYLMIGAYGQDYDVNGLNMLNSAGAAYFYVFKNSTWSQHQKLVGMDRAAGDFFGYSVAISADQIALGSSFNKLDSASNNSLNNAGAVYTYQTCLPTAQSLGTVHICTGDSALIFGSFQNTAGIYTDTLLSLYGCDSILTMELAVSSPSFSTTNTTSCNNYIWNDSTYTSSGTYTWQGTGANGCDSIATLNLTILTPDSSNTAISACSSFSWNDSTYTTTGTYTWLGPGVNGCDSLATLNLTILNPASGTDSRTECDSYTWIDGINYSASNNTATFTIAGGAANGCDSLVTLNLTINTVTDITTTLNSNTLTANNTLATYVWLDCNNNFAVIPGETSQSFSAASNGNYAVLLTQNGCTDTSDCVAITTIGIVYNSFSSNVVISPNPTMGNLVISFDEVQEQISTSLYSIEGKLIKENRTDNESYLSFEIAAPKGIYLLRISDNSGQSMFVRIIKE